MKSKMLILVYVLVVAALVLAACAPQQGVTQAPPEQTKLRVVNLINGVLGDKSFFDSANRGMEMAKKDFGIEVKTIEAGIDLRSGSRRLRMLLPMKNTTFSLSALSRCQNSYKRWRRSIPIKSSSFTMFQWITANAIARTSIR